MVESQIHPQSALDSEVATNMKLITTESAHTKYKLYNTKCTLHNKTPLMFYIPLSIASLRLYKLDRQLSHRLAYLLFA